MTDAISQARWRARKQKGLVIKTPCQTCQKLISNASQTYPLCRLCWLKTEDGKDYTRKKVAKHRNKNK